MKKIYLRIGLALVLISVVLSCCACQIIEENPAYTFVNDNVPQFTKDEITDESFESYSELDKLNRCGPAVACIGKDIMPTEERGAIGNVKPTGWHLVKYDIVEGKYLYNRCHLIGYQLTGENDNEKNLITGTRYMNTEGMLPFENRVASYIKETGNHVMYRVTPVYTDDNLLADGVQMEALSVEDGGFGLAFNVFVYNIQPGIQIDYKDGTSRLIEGYAAEDVKEQPSSDDNKDSSDGGGQITYVLNISSRKFHYPDCPSVDDIKQKNREDYYQDRNSLIEKGYLPCGACKP